LAVITDADVVTCSRGVSVRVDVTKTGGNVTSGGSAPVNDEGSEMRNSKRKGQAVIEISFSRERGVVGARPTGFLA